MKIPTKLITTTIDEFKAEGYECKTASCEGDGIVAGDSSTQVVTLVFHKTETKPSEDDEKKEG